MSLYSSFTFPLLKSLAAWQNSCNGAIAGDNRQGTVTGMVVQLPGKLAKRPCWRTTPPWVNETVGRELSSVVYQALAWR
jgi:hypothetical protein